jgi:hypothetical protein
MRHALIESRWHAALCSLVLGIVLLFPRGADAQEPVLCPTWNTFYGCAANQLMRAPLVS